MERELIQRLATPKAFSSREIATETTTALQNETMMLGRLEVQRLSSINNLLGSTEIQALIDEGKIRLGVIKPQLNEGENQFPSGEEADFVGGELGAKTIVFSFSALLMPRQEEEFYGEMDRQSTSAGPVTFLLLHGEEGDAISLLRDRTGEIHPSIAVSLVDNLIHLSDSPESARREIAVLYDVTQTAEKQARAAKGFPGEATLSEIGVLKSDQELISAERIYDSRQNGDGWIYGYKVVIRTADDELETKYLKEKNLISMGGDLAFKAQEHERRIGVLAGLGIPQPGYYGRKRGTIYQEFIVSDGTEVMLGQLKKGDLSNMQIRIALDQLINIARKLDNAGFSTRNYLGDLIYDNSDDQFKYIDVGQDLGPERLDGKSQLALDTLLTRFPHFREYINERLFDRDLPKAS